MYSKRDFGHLCGVAEGVGPGCWQDVTAFRPVASARRRHQSLFAPDCPAHGGEGVAEGRLGFGVPRRRGRPALAGGEPCRQKGHDREQGEQAGLGARDRPVGPLPLRLDA